MSSSQILAPSSACLPLAARPPVKAMLKPILIGSLFCACAVTTKAAQATTATAAAAIQANVRNFRSCSILVLPIEFVFCILGAFLRAALEGASGLNPLDHDRFHLARAATPECCGAVIFRRCETGDALLQRRKLNHNEAVEFVRPLHDLEAPATRQHLAAEPGDDVGHQIGIFFCIRPDP